ncbi:hypothetical protein Tco_1149875 [Tanacetum coccineum]
MVLPLLLLTADGLSAIPTHLGSPVMLDSCSVTTCMQSWGCMDYARCLVDIWADRALKESMVISVPNTHENGVTLHTIKVEYEWKPPRCGICLVFGHYENTAKCVITDLRKQVGTSHDGFQILTWKPLLSNAFDALGDTHDTDHVVVSSSSKGETKEDRGKSKDVLVEDTKKKA